MKKRRLITLDFFFWYGRLGISPFKGVGMSWRDASFPNQSVGNELNMVKQLLPIFGVNEFGYLMRVKDSSDPTFISKV